MRLLARECVARKFATRILATKLRGSMQHAAVGPVTVLPESNMTVWCFGGCMRYRYNLYIPVCPDSSLPTWVLPTQPDLDAIRYDLLNATSRTNHKLSAPSNRLVYIQVDKIHQLGVGYRCHESPASMPAGDPPPPFFVFLLLSTPLIHGMQAFASVKRF